MLLHQMISLLEIRESIGNLNIEIRGLSPDSRTISRGWLFVAIQGESQDGRAFIREAVQRGAAAVVLDGDQVEGFFSVKADSVGNQPCGQTGETGLEEFAASTGVAVILVENARKALARLACAFYNYPADKLRLIGVTGTKGKTTTTFMLKAILEQAGYKVGLVGSIAAYIGERQIAETDRTTPESIELQRLLAQMAEEKVEIAIIEVSSQAMKMHRTEGCQFEVAVFTNFSKDHISPKEHATMEEYFACKCKLLENAQKLVLNLDDERVAKVRELFTEKQVLTYATEQGADFFVPRESVRLSTKGTCFDLQLGSGTFEALQGTGSPEIKFQDMFVSIPGMFSVYNALAAMTAASYFTVNLENCRTALSHITVLGRSELVPNDRGITIMIDYAHTPASLECILLAARRYVQGRLICAWGVGGDRDKEKRPIMGEISGRLADFTVLMSDQVRTEDPLSILKDIEVGVQKTGKPYTIIVDRTEGIRYALAMAKPGDMVLIPGLGHDTYLERNGVKYPYDEREVIAGILQEDYIKSQ